MGRRWLVLQTILLLLPACARLPGDATSRYLLVRQARALIETGAPKQAQKLLQRVVKSEPRPESWFNLGLAQRAAGRDEQAERSWRTALALDPAQVPSLYHLAELRQEGTPSSEALEEARALLLRAAAVDASNAAIQGLLARVCRALGDTVAASAAREEAERIDPGRAGAAPEIYGFGSLLLPKLRQLPRLSRTPARFVAASLGHASTGAVPFGPDALLLRGNRALLRADSAGAVRRWAPVPLGDDPVVLGCTGLFDSDADLDLLVCTRADSAAVSQPTRVWLLRGGKGSAAAVLEIGPVVHALCPLDVDGDGDLDLVLGVDAAAGLRLCRNDGTGRFAPDEPLPGYADFGPALGVTAADLDGDARLDLVCLDQFQRLRVLGARGEGRFVAIGMLAGLAGQRARALACADLDADGDMDLLLGDDEGLWVWSNEGAARFVRTAAYRDALAGWTKAPSRGVAVAAIHVADLDNDGLVDVVSQHFAAAPPVLARSQTVTTSEDAAPAPRRLEPLLPLPGQTRVAIWHNEGSGLIADVTEKSGCELCVFGPAGLASGDFDHDGDLDLVGAGADSVLRVLWNEGGTVQRHLVLELVDPARPAACFGARLELHTGTRALYQEMHGPTAWLGVGDATMAELVRVVWPDGSVQNHLEVPLPPTGSLRVTRARDDAH